jgi:hypothetical protein
MFHIEIISRLSKKLSKKIAKKFFLIAAQELLKSLVSFESFLSSDIEIFHFSPTDTEKAKNWEYYQRFYTRTA